MDTKVTQRLFKIQTFISKFISFEVTFTFKQFFAFNCDGCIDWNGPFRSSQLTLHVASPNESVTVQFMDAVRFFQTIHRGTSAFHIFRRGATFPIEEKVQVFFPVAESAYQNSHLHILLIWETFPLLFFILFQKYFFFFTLSLPFFQFYFVSMLNF